MFMFFSFFLRGRSDAKCPRLVLIDTVSQMCWLSPMLNADDSFFCVQRACASDFLSLLHWPECSGCNSWLAELYLTFCYDHDIAADGTDLKTIENLSLLEVQEDVEGQYMLALSMQQPVFLIHIQCTSALAWTSIRENGQWTEQDRLGQSCEGGEGTRRTFFLVETICFRVRFASIFPVHGWASAKINNTRLGKWRVCVRCISSL